jgi:hypothetical protein
MVGDSCGHASNEKLAPLDVRVGGESTSAQKGAFDCRDNDVMGGLELGEGHLWACENDKVA